MGTVLTDSLRAMSQSEPSPKTQGRHRRLIPLFSVCVEMFRTGVLHSCKVWFVTSAQRTGGAGLLISIKGYCTDPPETRGVFRALFAKNPS